MECHSLQKEKLKTGRIQEGKVDSHFAGRPLSFGENTPLNMESVHEAPNRRFPPCRSFVWWYIWLSPLKKRDNKK